MLTALIAVLLLALPSTRPAEPDASGRALAERVARAAGLDVWPTVTRVRFTFNVYDGAESRMTATHDWDVRADKDTVTWGGRTVTVDVGTPPEPDTPEREAFVRWTNDTYWLLAPLKLLDGGVIHGPAWSTRDFPPSRGGMTIAFDGVGMTPGDRYDLTIDLRKDQITGWTYRPNDEVARQFSWGGYGTFNGLTLATEFTGEDGRRIVISDVVIDRD